MKKAKILSLLVVVLLVATVFAALAFTSSAATSQDPADAEDFLDVVWVDDSDHSKGFTLKGIEGGPWDEKYADPDAYPFVIATSLTQTKGTSSMKYTLIETTFSSTVEKNLPYIYDANGNKVYEYVQSDIQGFMSYLSGSSTGAMMVAKNALTGNKYNDAGEITINSSTKDSYIFMRTSVYTLKSKPVTQANEDSGISYSATTCETFSNFSQAKGTIYFDMRGGSIVVPSGYGDALVFLINAKANSGKCYHSSLVVNDGSFSLAAGEVARYNMNTNAEITKDLNELTFNNCEFKLAANSTSAFFFSQQKGQTTATNGNARASFTLNDCVYDFATNKPTKSFNIFYNFADTSRPITNAIKLNGGEIKAGEFNVSDSIKIGLLDTATAMSSTQLSTNVTFEVGKGSDNEYLKLVLPNNADAKLVGTNFAPTALKIYDSTQTRLGFNCDSIENGVKTYTLTPITADVFDLVINGKLIEEDVSIDYYSALEYPFIVKYNNANANKYNLAMFLTMSITKDTNAAGAFKTTNAGAAFQYAKEFINKNGYTYENGYTDENGIVPPEGYSELNTAYVYARRDYTAYDYTYYAQTNNVLNTTTTTSVEQYSNIAQISGVLTFDLCGFTLYDSPNRTTASFFSGDLKAWSTTPLFPVCVNIKNGSIVINSGRPLVSFASKTGVNGRKITYNFDDIEFIVTKAYVNGAVIARGSTGTGTNYAIANFTNCVFDITDAAADSVTLFGLGDKYTNTLVTVKGGSINAGGKDIVLFHRDTTNPGDIANLVFAKNENGEYTTLTSSQTLNLTANDGKLTFVKQGTTTTYILVPTAALNLEFTPMASVTLDSNLILNIYIPDHAGLKSATLNGTPVALTNAEGGYYIVSTALEAKEAAKTLALEVVLDANDTELRGTFEFSTVKYADKLLKSGAIEAEKTLAKDMLAYVKSAYNYFDSADKATVADEIDAVIGNYTVALNRVDGATASDANDILAGTTFALDSTPAIRFYLNKDGSDASQFSFNVGGRLVSAEDISTGVEAAAGDFNGYNYVDISLYAYRMIENVTITKGANTATYHINYYYDNMDTTNVAQVEMITAFYNYCVSANEYRTEVTK